MIVVDSSVWIDHLRDVDNDRVRFLRSQNADRLLIGDLILLELLQGARDDRHATQLAAGLRKFRTVSMSNPDLAIAAARNFRQLRAKGITVRRTIDLVIATFCLERGHSLLHSDRDFLPFVRHFGLTLANAAH